MSRNNGIKITPAARKSGSKMFVAQSLPMAVPIFNQRNDDDYEEVRSSRHFFISNRRSDFDELASAIAIHIRLKLLIFASHSVFVFPMQYPDRQDNVDIAASIKALAQSVHGEAIFGDLPKPRFSTEI